MCGDSCGLIWVYDLYTYLTGEIDNPLFGGPPLISKIEPIIHRLV